MSNISSDLYRLIIKEFEKHGYILVSKKKYEEAFLKNRTETKEALEIAQEELTNALKESVTCFGEKLKKSGEFDEKQIKVILNSHVLGIIRGVELANAGHELGLKIKIPNLIDMKKKAKK